MRATGNPDFFAGLPMQTAQQVLKDAVHDFKAWLDSLKKYKKDPSNYTGKPKCRDIANQAVRLLQLQIRMP